MFYDLKTSQSELLMFYAPPNELGIINNVWRDQNELGLPNNNVIRAQNALYPSGE